MSGLVRLVQLSNVRDEWIVRIGISQQRTNAQQDFGDGQCRTPLILENVQADSAVGIDVAVVNACREMDLGWLCKKREWWCGVQRGLAKVLNQVCPSKFQRNSSTQSTQWPMPLCCRRRHRRHKQQFKTHLERVIRGKVNVQEEHTTGIGRVFRSHNGRLPMEHIIAHRSCRTIGRRIFAEVDQFLCLFCTKTSKRES